MKPKYIVGALAAIVLVGSTVMTVESKKIEAADFSAASSSGRTTQVKGTWVKEKGSNYDSKLNQFRFTMRDEHGLEMPVVLHASKPNNFELASHVIATGEVEEGTFHASHVLTKCPSKYQSDSLLVGA